MDKAPDAFRTISEVADELDVPQHVLRFWETRFAQIKPMKRSGGRRYYRRDDVELLRGIRHLLYGQGYTIRGVQRILREQGIKAVQGFNGGIALRRALPEIEAEVDDLDEADQEAELHEEVGDIEPAPRMNGTTEVESAIPQRMSDESTALLQGALDELIACRRLLEGALSVD